MPRKELPKISMQEAIDNFAEALPPGLAESVRRRKRAVLTILVKHCPKGEHTSTRNLREIYFQDCLKDLAAGASESENAWRRRNHKGVRTGRRGQSLKGDRTTLRQFAQHLIYRKWVDPAFNPLYEITSTARNQDDTDPRKLRQHKRIPFEDWSRLFDAATHPRDRLLTVVGIYFARRASDLVIMQWKHLDLVAADCELFNVKKGRRVANGVPLPIFPDVMEEIRRYLEWFVPRYGQPDPEWPLFPSKLHPGVVNTGERQPANWPLNPAKAMLPQRVTNAIQDVLGVFGWEGDHLAGEGAHTLRRSGGRWVAVNCGLAVAQRLLDHATEAQTRAYVGWSQEDERLNDFMRGASPQRPEVEASRSEPEPVEEVTRMAEVVDLFSRRQVA